MNSLSQSFCRARACVPVSGSDRLRTDVTARLEALGAAITYEHRPENVEGASLIVRTAAVHDENPEIVRAHNELGIPVMESAQRPGATSCATTTMSSASPAPTARLPRPR
ncbi:MAG: Mur ligase domain-containing protein [Butyricicoccaceae bacterium]